MNQIKIFYYIACMGSVDNWSGLVKKQIKALDDSGLYDACSNIYVCVGTDNYKRNKKEVKILKSILPKKYKLCYFSNIKQYEFPALNMVKQYTNKEDKVLYMHTKGVSRTGEGRVAGDKWESYLSWGCIERWKEHIEKLDFCDISGVQLTKLNGVFTKKCGSEYVYAGNFWFANGDYIQKLKMPEVCNNRWLAEGAIFGAAPIVFDLHNLTNGEMITTSNTFALPSFNRKVYDPRYKEKCPPMIEIRTKIINQLIEKFGYRRYCEVGVWCFHNFSGVECKNKVCVDPFVNNATYVMTSDDYFKEHKEKKDLFFIDGLHTREQVKKDILNALDRLSEKGTIVCHDMLPNSKQEAKEMDAYDNKGDIWCGDVYKAWIELRMTRPDLAMYAIDTDFGTSIIRKGKQKLYVPEKGSDPYSFSYYIQHRKELMNIIEPEDWWEFLEDLK